MHVLGILVLQVLAVKKQIEECQGKDAFPCSQQLLIHQGKVLKDDTTMDDNKVSENGFLVVMLTKVFVVDDKVLF
jgi:UV excision repair protein RAD23